MKHVPVDGASLTLETFDAVVRGEAVARLTPEASARMVAARGVIERAAASGDAVYGVNTGFGNLADVRIADADLRLLQERLVLSHAAGMGEPLADLVVRGMLLLRANTLAKGYSGARPILAERLLLLLERGILPLVPSRGSVGASGDLAPLAHLALPLIGRGRVRVRGVEQPAAEALTEAGIEPLTLEIREGLALINGTQAMTSLTAVAALETRRLLRLADAIGALSCDAFRGTDAAFDARVHAVRPYPGQIASAANLWDLMRDSPLRESHRGVEDGRVQDPYSFRCMPQVHGTVRDALVDVEAKLRIEMNAATDNPLVFADDDCTISGGNFHGAPIALAADLLAIALADVGSISERRIEKLTDAAFSGLPPFLVADAGLNSGFMMAHVTAAALVSENKGLAHPASVDSLPTSAEKEDHVSMGMWAGLKLRAVVANVRRILAIELLAAGQGIDLHRPLRTSAPLEELHALLRRTVARWDHDREMAPDLAAAEELLASSDLTPLLERLR